MRELARLEANRAAKEAEVFGRVQEGIKGGKSPYDPSILPDITALSGSKTYQLAIKTLQESYEQTKPKSIALPEGTDVVTVDASGKETGTRITGSPKTDLTLNDIDLYVSEAREELKNKDKIASPTEDQVKARASALRRDAMLAQSQASASARFSLERPKLVGTSKPVDVGGKLHLIGTLNDGTSVDMETDMSYKDFYESTAPIKEQIMKKLMKGFDVGVEKNLSGQDSTTTQPSTPQGATSFNVDGVIYDIPADRLEAFKKKYPKAIPVK
jgi:hypothetical protein